MPANVRSIPALWNLRQRPGAAIVCRDDPREYEALRGRLPDLEAELVVEPAPGVLSDALGRPSVTVIDRYGTIGLQEEHSSVDRVLTQLEAFEMFCSECTVPLWVDPGAKSHHRTPRSSVPRSSSPRSRRWK
jgi:hypothetical protein